MKLSDLCSSEEGIPAIEQALSHRTGSKSHQPNLKRHVQVQDIEAAISAISSNEQIIDEESGSTNGGHEGERSVRRSRSSRTPIRGKRRNDCRSRSANKSSSRERSARRTRALSDIGSLDLGRRSPRQHVSTMPPPVTTTEPVDGVERSELDWEQDSTQLNSTSQNRPADTEEASQVPQDSQNCGSSDFELPSSDEILDRCARISDADGDDLSRSFNLQLKRRSQLDWFEQQRMRIPHLLNHIRKAEYQKLIQEESRLYTNDTNDIVSSMTYDLNKPFEPRYRNIMHSLLQQVIREDPLNYAVTVAIQPDRQWQLFWLPTCVRIGRTETDTNILLGSFATTSYTPGSRQRPFTSHYFAWMSKNSDSSQPHIVLRVDNRCVRQGDLVDLDLDGYELCRVNQECLIPAAYLDDDDDRPRDLASVAFPHCSAIGAALAGSQSWKSPQVQDEMAQLFGDDEEKAAEYVDRVRARILKQWPVYYEEIKRRYAGNRK